MTAGKVPAARKGAGRGPGPWSRFAVAAVAYGGQVANAETSVTAGAGGPG